MRPRLALATYDRAPALAPDDQALVPALAALGIDAEPAVWSSDAVLWETFDGVVVRSCWDYHLRLAEFGRWLDRLDASRVPVWNAPALVAWNADKHYLADLAARGVSVVPTVYTPRGDAAAVERAAAEAGWTRVVLKPAVSASGYETHALALPAGGAPDATIRRTIAQVAAVGDVLVQPFIPEVPRDGEWSIVCIDGVFSHAVLKRAATGEFRVQAEHGGRAEIARAPAAVVQQALAVLDALPEVPAYARVDGVDQGGRFVLMELELIEPHLFLALAPGAADRLAAAIAQRLSAL